MTAAEPWTLRQQMRDAIRPTVNQIFNKVNNDKMNLHTYKSNRLELPNTKERGNITTSVKNTECTADIEKEIFSKLMESGGEIAVFTYWYDGSRIESIYKLSEMQNRCFIEYLNKDNGFKKTQKYFDTFEQAKMWGKHNLENFSTDMIKSQY